MKKYVITSYIPGSTTNRSCFNAIKNYMEVNKVDELITLPTKANYIEEQDELPDEGFTPSIGGFFLNKSLYVSDMLLNHNLLDPIRGLESISSEKGSLVVAAPRHRFKSVARSLKHSAMPRGIWCTGTISDPYYKDTSSGLKVRNYHTFGAIVVTIQNSKIFHIRQLEFIPETNSLCDMNIEYFANGDIRKIRPSISLGDLHPPFTNPDILNKTSELIKDLKCENIMYHDAFDFAQPGSHHLKGRYLTKAFAQESIYTIENEVNVTMRVLNFLAKNSAKDSKHYIVASNHNEHLDKYLDSFEWRDDTGNLLYALELVMQKVKYKRGMEQFDSLEYALRKAGLSSKFKFLKRKDFLEVHGVEVSNHGDFGANGSRSGAASQGLAFTGGKVITGHCLTKEHSVNVRGKGFVKISEVTKDDVVLSYDSKNDRNEWVDVLDTTYVKDYKGAMVEIGYFPYFKQDVTLNHHFYTKCGKYVSLNELTKNYSPQDIPLTSNPPIEDSEIREINENLLRLRIAIAADGSFGNNLIRFHLKKQRKIDRLKKLLKLNGIEYSHNIRSTGNSVINLLKKTDAAKDIYADVEENGKFLTKSLLNLSLREKEIILEECVLWDGSKLSHGSRQFFSNKEEEASVINSIANELGYRTSVITKDCGGFIVTFNIKRTPPSSMVKTSHTRVKFDVIPRQEESIEVFCITTKNMNFWVRNDETGQVSLTGNTHSPEIGVYNNYVNGTMTHLTMPYTNDSGTSSWLNTHTLIYPNGGRSHIHIIKG